MNHTSGVRKPHRNYHVARMLGCVLLGFLVWLLAGYWLDIKPLWTLHFDPNGTAIVPFHEDASGKFIVAGEWQMHDKTNAKPSALVVLNSRTGIRLRQIPSTTHHAKPCWGYRDYHLPRWRNGVVWRFSNQGDSSDSDAFELRTWNLQENREEVVHRWKAVLPFSLSFEWPEQSSILVSETQVRWQFALLVMSTTWEPMILHTMMMDHYVILWKPSLYQTWQLPETSSGSVKLLASWVSYEHTRLAISSDGERVALTCGHMLSHYDAVRKAQQRGFQQLGVAEIFDCYTQGKRAIQLFDSRTGKLLKEITAPDQVYYYGAYWADSFLYTGCLTCERQTPISLREFCALKDSEFSLERMGVIGDAVFLHDGTPVTLPAKLSVDQRCSVESDDGQLIAKFYSFDELNNSDVEFWQLLQRQGHQLVVSKQCRIRNIHDTIKHPINSSQIIVKERLYPERPDWLKTCANYSNWIKEYMERNWPVECSEVVVKDINTGSELHRWRDVYPLMDKSIPSRQHLFLVKHSLGTHDLDVNSMAALECYTLPLQIHSPWWARGAGVVAALFGWVLFAIRRT